MASKQERALEQVAKRRREMSEARLSYLRAIRQARDEAGCSVVSIAEALGCTHQRVYRLLGESRALDGRR